MNDFSTLVATANPAAGTITLTWDLPQFSIVNGATINQVVIKREPMGSDTDVTIATTSGDFPGSTYLDTPPADGQYTYKILVTAGIAPELTVFESNSASASTTESIPLNVTISGRVVTLTWSVGVGNAVLTVVERSADGGLTWFPVRHINGLAANTYSEEVPETGVYSYRVRVVLPPATCDAVGQSPILTSSVVVVLASAGVVVVCPDLAALLTAANFALLAGSTITNVVSAGTIITGDVGNHPGSALTGFPPGVIVGATHLADATALQAKTDLTAAYNTAAGLAVDVDLGVGDNQLGSTTLFPGVYRLGHAPTANLIGSLTLDANGVTNPQWVFQFSSDFVTANNAQVVLTNGAQACQVFWQVGTSATIGGGSDIVGTIMADQSISLGTGATLVGRALARVAAVTLDSNVVTKPS